MSEWSDLPDILLEDIFVLLPPKQRHYASQVCPRWYQTFYAPRVWEKFILAGNLLTKKRFNLIKGYQKELCPRKTQLCLTRVGYLFKKIIITPMSDYYNLYEFIRVLRSFLEYFDEYPMPLLHTFHFTFACETRGVAGVIVHGTGGKILEEMNCLLSNLSNLREIKLNQLMLDVNEVSGVFDAVAKNNTGSLRVIELLSCTRVPFPLCDVTRFYNLQKLIISPQHLNDETILLIGGTLISDLHIVQGTHACPTVAVSSEAWKLLKEMAPFIRVTLECRGATRQDILIQPCAPVTGIVYSSCYSKVSPASIGSIIDYYYKDLQIFAQERLPRLHGSRSFHERGDSLFLQLIRRCPLLHTLVIRERVSMATVILLAKEGNSLKFLAVRQNALLKRCDWPKNPEWSNDFYTRLKETSRSYDLLIGEVSKYMGFKWQPLTDKEFKKIHM